MGGAHSTALHVMKPVELMAEFGLTQRDILSFEASYDAVRGSSPHITRNQWMDHWNGSDFPIDPDNDELGKRIWNAFDVDGNNKMDLEEWSLFCAISQFGSQKHKLTASFALCDKSQDGLIAEGEVFNVLRRSMRMGMRNEVRQKYSSEEAQNAKARRQLVKESKRVHLSPEQTKMLKERSKQIMEAADKDKNGKISLDEFLAAAQENPDLFKDLLI